MSSLENIYDHDGQHKVAKDTLWWSISAACFLISLKFYAYLVTGSIAVLGTLTDSIFDVSMSVMLMMAARLSAKPADANHRYGHGKAEGLASFIQAAMLAAGALFLVLESIQRLVVPQDLAEPKIGIVVALVAVLVSVIVVLVQKRALQKTSSLVIEADLGHYKSDIVLNSGVLLALFLSAHPWLDSLIGVLIAFYFAATSYDIVKKSLSMLMDEELEEGIRSRIEEIVLAHNRVLGMHDLRTRRSGIEIYISFDIEADPELSLNSAHEITKDVEAALLREFPNAQILIHVDPQGDTHDHRHRVQGVHL